MYHTQAEPVHRGGGELAAAIQRIADALRAFFAWLAEQIRRTMAAIAAPVAPRRVAAPRAHAPTAACYTPQRAHGWGV